MKKTNRLYALIFAVLCGAGCASKSKEVYKNPPGYDLNNPVKYEMTEKLTEISGIAFHQGKGDSVYAEQDEKGRVYYFKLGDKEVSHAEFGSEGDYEDIAIMGSQVIMLRSDGVLFEFPLGEVRSGKITNVQQWDQILPKGEYEGLYADEKSNTLYALCKHCSDDSPKKNCSVYGISLAADGSVKQSGQYSLNVKDIEKMAGEEKTAFHPSALAKNPGTKDWYILSAVNKMLVVADANWKIKGVYPLKASIFRQPEGMVFDNQNNLYISNEGDEISQGNILKFDFKK